MTSRGPFQPELFYDSNLFKEFHFFFYLWNICILTATLYNLFSKKIIYP